MHAIRPLKLAALAAVTATAGVLFVSPAAAATPAAANTSMTTMPVSAAVPLGSQYNQASSFTVSISVTSIVRGGRISFVITGTVNGRQYVVTVFSDPLNLGTLTADATGSASGNFSTESLDVGQHELRVVAADTGETVNVSFEVKAAQASVVPAGTGTTASGSGLAFTGANAVVPLAALGLVLVIGGGAAVVVTRRRQDDAA